MAPSHYLNQCWLIIVISSGNHLRAILQKLPQLLITEISLKITYLKFLSNLPGTNEFKALEKLMEKQWSIGQKKKIKGMAFLISIDT